MLTIKDGEFKMDGESFRIYSGSMHYFRIMPEYWEDRLRKLKAAVSTRLKHMSAGTCMSRGRANLTSPAGSTSGVLSRQRRRSDSMR